MASFNFTIYYRLGVKIGHADFTSRLKTFIPKKDTSILISTQREQKQSAKLILPDYFQLKQTNIPIINYQNI